MILVDRDTTPNATLDQRRYPLQNWRADVSLTVDDSGVVVGWTKYDAYGLPIAMPQRDFNSDAFANDQDCGVTHLLRGRPWEIPWRWLQWGSLLGSSVCGQPIGTTSSGRGGDRLGYSREALRFPRCSA